MEEKKQIRMVAKTLFGMEDILAEELRALGVSKLRTMKRSVEFWGDMRMLYKANLWCRTATRILRPLRTFNASNGDELYRGVFDVDWSRFMSHGNTLAVDSVVNHSDFNNSLFVAQKTKDAIVDQFRIQSGSRPDVDLDDPDIRINIHIHENRATLALDASGIPLHKRGYRIDKGGAPINEVLAAGIIHLSGWDMASPFIDGMCGSGTIIIEAALMARNMAPGLLRDKFAFMQWKDFRPALFNNIRAKAADAIKPTLPFAIFGSDIDGARIKDAEENAKRARIEGDVTFKKRPFEIGRSTKEMQSTPDGGTLIINPPYGERLGVEHIEIFYKMIGDTLKKFYEGFDAFIFTSNLQAAKRIGLRASRRVPMFNGPLECRLLKYEMYKGSKS